MSENTATSSPQVLPLANDERTAQVMVYTSQAIWWGNIVIKEKVRINMWLRTSVAPEIVHIDQAKMFFQTPSELNKPLALKDAHIFTNDILAYHILPPEKEPLDYDPNEPNRHFEPVTCFSGAFRFDGTVLLSNLHNIGRYIETTRERFISLYDAEVYYPLRPSQTPLKSPQILVRVATASFVSR